MEPISILVIEDDEIVAKTIERVLRGDEFKVSVANSGVEGLQLARRNVPKLVILDVIMPGMDGYTVCREMRIDPLLEDVPILFLTAKAKDEDKIVGFKAGADDYLGKPFNVDELLLRIRAILRRTRRLKETQPAAEAPVEPVVQTAPQETPPAAMPSHIMRIGPFTLNTRSYEFTSDTQGKIRLTPVPYDLL